MRRHGRWVVLAAALAVLLLAVGRYNGILVSHLNYRNILDKFNPAPRCEVPLLISSQDQNRNGIPDALDIVAGARGEVERGTVYNGAYFPGGYPPEGQGACTDVAWRAFKAAGYDLKQMVDEDIKNAPEAYGATGRMPDPSIDFRRVSNLQVFFQRHAQELTTEVISNDAANLSNWQPGDIVIYGQPKEHIAVISDQRERNGVPWIIHNCGPTASEGNYLLSWYSEMTYHFRFIRVDEGG